MDLVNSGDRDFDRLELRIIKIGEEYQIIDAFGRVLLETDADDFPF